MSDPMLLQPPIVMAQAGACGLLPPNGPTTWEKRKEIDTKSINRLCNKIESTMPSHVAAARYLQEWMKKPRLPEPAPGSLDVMSLRFGETIAGYEFGKVYGEALAAETSSSARHIRIKRRRLQGRANIEVSLPAYVDFRISQGVSVEDVVAEWNGAQLLL